MRPKDSQGNAAVGQGIGPLIARISGMPPDPMPFDLVHATMHQSVQALPEVGVFHRLFRSRDPALAFPAMDSFGDALAHVLTVEKE